MCRVRRQEVGPKAGVVRQAAAEEGACPDLGRLEGLIKGVAGAAGFIEVA